MSRDTGPTAKTTLIELCGTYTVQLDGRRVEQQLPGRGGRLAFAYLVLSRDRPTSREALAAAIWENGAPQHPDSALRTLLARLRAVVGQDRLRGGRGEISLALPGDALVDLEVATADLAQAEGALAGRQWQHAFDCARRALPVLSADLLPTLHADWVELARRSHSERHIRALTCVATAGLELGEAEQLAIAGGAAREMIELEPLRETGHALLVRALAAQGDRAQALLAYDELRSQLDEELGVSPGPELRTLHQQLLRDEALTPPAPAAAAAPNGRSEHLRLPARAAAQAARPIFGRAAELAWLERELAPNHPEGRTLALLAGEPGIGKTRLAAEFARSAHARGANVLWGACHDGGFVPYEPFAEIVRRRLAPLADEERAALLQRTGADVLELVPGLARGRDLSAPPAVPDRHLDANAQRYRLFDAVASLLGDGARQRPLILVLEDLHWADPSTLNLLLHLHRVDDGTPIAVLATYRDAEVAAGRHLGRTLAELHRVARVVTTELRGLDEQHTRALVGALSGSSVRDDIGHDIHARSAGNPFFVGEIVRWGQDGRGGDPGDISEGLKDLLTRRIGHLSADAVELLHTASVIGRDFDRAALERVCRHDGERLLDLLEEAIRARVIEEAPGDPLRYSFCHALIGEALYGALSRTRRARIHRAIAEAFSDRGATGGAAELAHHLHAAIDGPDGARSAWRASVAAGDHAMSQRAYEDAAGHYDSALAALAQAGDADGERCRVLLARGAALSRCGDGAAARTTFEQAAEIARGLGDGRLLASAAIGFGGRGHVAISSGRANPRLVGLIEEALLRLPTEATGLRARLLGRLSVELLWSAALDRRTTLSSEALVLAAESGDEAVIGYALAARRFATWSPGNVRERLALSTDAVTIAERIDDPELILQCRQWLAADLLELGDVPHAAEEMRRHARLAASLRQPYHRWVAGGSRVARAHLAGASKRAESLAEQAFADGVRANEDDAFQSLSSQLFWIRRDQGRLGELGDLVEEALERFEETGPFWHAVAALRAVETGEPSVAEALLDRVAERDELAAIPIDPNWSATIACLAEAAARLEHGPSAARIYAELAPHSASNIVVAEGGICLGSAARHLGMLARTKGWWRRAEDGFEQALRFDAQLGAPALLARTQHEYALMLLRRGRPHDAKRALELEQAARRTAARLGMRPLGHPHLPALDR